MITVGPKYHPPGVHSSVAPHIGLAHHYESALPTLCVIDNPAIQGSTGGVGKGGMAGTRAAH